jgi:hypothetical protein
MIFQRIELPNIGYDLIVEIGSRDSFIDVYFSSELSLLSEAFHMQRMQNRYRGRQLKSAEAIERWLKISL